jgi:hypothetical protein
MNTDFLGFGYFEWVEVLARLTPRSRTPLPEFHPASVQSGEFYSEEFGAVVLSLFRSAVDSQKTMLSRFFGRALNTISQSTLARLIDRQIMTAGLGPDLHQGLTTGRFFGISDRVLRVLDRLPIQFGDHVP